MKILRAIPKALWKSLFLINFLTGLILLYPLFRILLTKEKWFPICFKVMRFWAGWICFIPGIRMKTSWEFPTKDFPEPCILCANHTSYLDIVMSYYAINHYFVFMGKAELKKVPLFNIFFDKMNILVNRSSALEAHKAFLSAKNSLEKGISVFLFPEGTIAKHAPTLLSFKNGAFKLAIESQVPVVPVTFVNNWKILQNGGFFKANGAPGIAKVIIHQPISTKGLGQEDLLPLKNKVEQIIREELSKHYENRH